MPRLRLPVSCLLLLACVPVLVNAAVGMKRNSLSVRTESYGQLVPGPDVEMVGVDPALVPGWGVFSVSTGLRLATLLAPFDVQGDSRQLVDLDGDGVSELLCLLGQPVNNNTLVSLQRWSGGAMTRVFPDVVIPNESIRYVGTMRLNSANPNAMVLLGAKDVYIVRSTGTIRYDSSTDGSFPNLGSGTLTASIADFDGDGFDEVDLVFEPDVVNGTWRNLLVGDLAPTAGAANESPTGVRLLPSRPNPSTGAARIAFETPRAAQVTLQIYDAAGRLVNRLASGPMGPGLHERVWDGRDVTGQRVPGGVYFYELVVDGAKETRKLVELR